MKSKVIKLQEENQSAAAAKPRRISVENFTMMQVRSQVVDFILNNEQGVLTVKVPTGGGKSLGLPWIIKEDIIPIFPETKVFMLEPLRTVTGSLRQTLAGLVLLEKVGMKVGNDQGLNYHSERFTVATIGSAFNLIKREKPNIVILDEFDLDQNGDGAIMQNELYHMLKAAQAADERLIVILASATPDLVNAEKFYNEFKFEILEVEDRMFEPDILEINLGSSNANNFKDIINDYALTISRLCGDEGIMKDGKVFKIPAGKNILCTVPSPVYFEELERKILSRTGSKFVEVVKVWSKSTDAEKQKLFRGGTQGKITVFIATDLIRRGGTPEIFATFPSGWQVRDYCNPTTGIEGTREERASQSDYVQDEGRCARKEKGLVIRSLDSKRPPVPMTFLERKPLETFLLNLIHREDLRDFRWWGNVSEEKISLAVNALKKVRAAEEDANGRLVLTTLGRAMRGIPGSLQMRSMIFEAFERNVLEQFLVISAGVSLDGIFVNAKDRYEIREKQAPLLNKWSDYLSILNIWGVISEALTNAGIEQVITNAHSKVNAKKEAAKSDAELRINRILAPANKLPEERKVELVAQIDEELKERLSLIELGRQETVEKAMMKLTEEISVDVSMEYGLYGIGIKNFVQNVLRSVSFLKGRKFVMNGRGEQVISLDLMRILTMGSSARNVDESVSDSIHKVLLRGYIDQIWVNISHRGNTGYFYKRIDGAGHDAPGIFPGSACFNNRQDYLIGLPIDLKGKKFLKNIVMLSREKLLAWLPEVAPQLIKIETGLEPEYDPEKDCCVSITKTSIFGETVEKKRVASPEHPEAQKTFIEYLIGKIEYGSETPFDSLNEVLQKNYQIKKETGRMNARAGERVFKILQCSDWRTLFKEKLQGAKCVAEVVDFDSLLLSPLDPAIIKKIITENPATLQVAGEALEIRYEQDWNNNFFCSTKVSEEFLRHVQIDKLYLPGGRRTVQLNCGSYSADSIPELVEKLEERRLEKAWEEKRRELEHTDWIRDPKDVIPYLSGLLVPVEIIRRNNGDGEPIFGYLSLYSDSDPDFQIRLRESEEEARKETQIGLERLLRKDCKNLFAVPEEEPWYFRWSYTSVGKVLELKLKEIMASVLEGLSSENYFEKVEWAKNEIETVKNSLREEYVSLEDFLDQEERKLEEKIIDQISYRDFVKSEIAQAREEMKRAKQLLGEMKYREARAACRKAFELAEPLVLLSRKRRGEYDRANKKWNSVGKSLYNLYRGYNTFREATEGERLQAEKIQDEIHEALENNNFDFVVEKVPEIKSWAEKISVLCSQREQERREKYPEGVWEAACGCASDEPDEIAEKGIELAKVSSDLVGEKVALYFLQSLTKGNKSKYEKQKKLLELIDGIEETEIGEWFGNLHYAVDIDASIKVGIAYFESKGVKLDKLNLQLAKLLVERNEYPQKVANAEIEVQEGEAFYSVFIEGMNPKTGIAQWEAEIKTENGETIKCIIDRFSKMPIDSETEYYCRFGNTLIDSPKYKVVIVYPFLINNRDFEKEISRLKEEISKKNEKETKEETKEDKIENLASELAAAFGGANIKIKMKN